MPSLKIISFHQLYQTEINMLRGLLYQHSFRQKNTLKPEDQVLFPDNNRQSSREGHFSKERQETSAFIYIDTNLNEINSSFQNLRAYEQDKIKFMTKVQVNESRVDGVRSRIKITKEPIFARGDIITFLLVFQWFPNTIKQSGKLRKGSFATQKEFSSLRVRSPKIVVEQQQLVNIVFLLSQKIYIEERYIDQFVALIADKNEGHSRQLNCLTILVFGEQKQRFNLTSTIADSNKYQYYQYDNQSMYNSLVDPTEKSMRSSRNDFLINRFTLQRKSSSRAFEKSPRNSVASYDKCEGTNTNRRNDTRFNLERVKKYFSAVEYLMTDNNVNVQMIAYHLGDNQNIIDIGFKTKVLQEVITAWPKYNTFTSLYNLNKERIMADLLEQATNNYGLMISMELEELTVTNLEDIFSTIKQFNDKVISQFAESAKEYINDSDYDNYLIKLENELNVLECQLMNNYAMTKFEYGSRVLRNLDKKNNKNYIDNYLLMKIIGRQEINQLDIGYRMYKQLLEGKLQHGFKQFVTKKNVFRSRYHSKNADNYDEDQLNNVENRIQICQEKKRMLDATIELGAKENQSLQMMVKLIQNTDKGDSIASQNLAD